MSLAALERAKLLSSASTLKDKRGYLEHLLTLPTYRDPQLTAYFAELVSLHFADVGDLQDQAVDAVLDLCEDDDEKTRISGVQALARIGKAEPRWVRGNTGVLLQLLESPPGELKYVRQALYDLLDVSPSDVFSMMAEDCKGSEDETGALSFLMAAKEKRAEILESGNHIDAERVFADGFYEVLATTAPAETRQILGLLVSLSTISGRKATSESTGKYAKTLTKSLPRNSTMGLTIPFIRLWMDLDRRHKWMDPRWILFFLGHHGEAVVSLMVEKEDRLARELLLLATRDLSRIKRSLEYRNDVPELDERSLLPPFISTMLKAASRLMDQTKKTELLEVVIYALYSVVTISRSTRDNITKSQARQFLDLDQKANRRKKDAKNDEVESWRNIRDMAEVMGDRDIKTFDLTPTWKRKSKEEKSEVKVEPMKVEPMKVDPPKAESSRQAERAPAVAPVVNPSAHEPAITVVPSQPPAEMIRIETKATPAPTPDGPSDFSILSRHKQPLPESNAAAIAATPELNVAAKSDPPAATSNTPGPVPSLGLNILARSQASNAPAPAPSSGLGILGKSQQSPAGPSNPTSPATASGLTIRAHAKSNTTASHDTPITVNQTQTSSKPDPGLGIRTSATKPESQTPEYRSLLSRMTSGNGSGNKRPREDAKDTPGSASGGQSSTPRSLADRLRDPSDPKKARHEVNVPLASTPIHNSSPANKARAAPSLFSRLTSGPIGSGSNQKPTNTSPGLTLKRTGVPPAPQRSVAMTITGRATPTHQPVQPNNQTPPVLQPETPVAMDDGVIRKGRGFANQSNVPFQPPLGFGQRGRGKELL